MKKNLLSAVACFAAAWLFASPAQAQEWADPTISYPGYGGEIYLTWPSNYKVEIIDDDAAGYVYQESTGTTFECLYYYWDLYASGNYMTFNIRKSNIIEGDTYVITLAASAYSITCDSVEIESRDLDYTWTYGASEPEPTEPEVVAYTSTYNDGTVKYVFEVGYPYINDGSYAILTRDGVEVDQIVLYDNENITIDWDLYAYVIEVAIPAEDIEANGNYVLTVPKDAYYAIDYDAAYNLIDVETVDLICEFTVGTDSLNVVAAGEVATDVYTVAGVCVLRNATKAQIQALPQGIYIINGKKIAIPK
ncbi:MAG: hypothetical protein LIP09_05505 [Bacteroidales bacterium]|nr:hypothetical protein [Bacteroidales bacterium]